MKKHLAIAALATAGAVLVAPAALAAPTAPAPTSAGTTTVSAPAPVGPETTISGPQTAKVGQEFKITGKTDKGLKGSRSTPTRTARRSPLNAPWPPMATSR